MSGAVDIARAREMRNRGLTLREIGAEFGVSGAWIHRLLGHAPVRCIDCAHCGRAIETRRASQRFCSSRCRMAENYDARVSVANAVRAGHLIRPSSCECCAREADVDAHHPDYSKPLEVEWLCRFCHMGAHAAERAAA